MIYLSVQPDQPYFHWQVEVYINNFKQIGINPNKIEVLFLYNGKPSDAGKALQQKYNTCRFFFYEDKRTDKSYIPSIKPWGFYRHLLDFPNLNSEPIFYHDSDIIFNEKIDETRFEKDDAWYLSDTISYIGYKYIISKGADQFLDMLDVLRLDRNTVINNQKNSGGAQYIVKHTTPAFWLKVYEDSPKLYAVMHSWEEKYKSQMPFGYTGASYHPIQKWCAEMWATLWNAWQFGHQTIVDKELDFVFATDTKIRAQSVKIIHNAGVTEKDSSRLFYKAAYIHKDPFIEKFDWVEPTSASRLYVDAIELAREVRLI
jgi:hypothetical protein